MCLSTNGNDVPVLIICALRPSYSILWHSSATVAVISDIFQASGGARLEASQRWHPKFSRNELRFVSGCIRFFPVFLSFLSTRVKLVLCTVPPVCSVLFLFLFFVLLLIYILVKIP